MNILAAIKREEKKLEKQMSKLQHQLNGMDFSWRCRQPTDATTVRNPESDV